MPSKKQQPRYIARIKETSSKVFRVDWVALRRRCSYTLTLRAYVYIYILFYRTHNKHIYIRKARNHVYRTQSAALSAYDFFFGIYEPKTRHVARSAESRRWQLARGAHIATWRVVHHSRAKKHVQNLAVNNDDDDTKSIFYSHNNKKTHTHIGNELIYYI